MYGNDTYNYTAEQLTKHLGNEGLAKPLKALEDTGKFVFFCWREGRSQNPVACICKKDKKCYVNKGKTITWICMDGAERMPSKKAERAKAFISFLPDGNLIPDDTDMLRMVWEATRA